MKSLQRTKQKESEETIRKLEKKGERSRDCGVNMKDVYTCVSATWSKKPKKMQFQKGLHWCRVTLSSCAAQSKSQSTLCVFLYLISFFLVLFLSFLTCLLLRVSDDKTVSHRRNSSHSNRNKIFTVIDFLTAHQSSTSVCAHLFVCPSVHTLRQGLTALLCVLCLRSPAVQSVLRESQVICESKEKQIAELKKMSDQSADSLKNEWEKKV